VFREDGCARGVARIELLHDARAMRLDPCKRNPETSPSSESTKDGDVVVGYGYEPRTPKAQTNVHLQTTGLVGSSDPTGVTIVWRSQGRVLLQNELAKEPEAYRLADEDEQAIQESIAAASIQPRSGQRSTWRMA
jgi:hypothetical protein